MLGRDVLKEDEATLREIIRSIDKKLDYALRDGSEGGERNFTLHLVMQRSEANVTLSIDDLKAAKNDLVRRNEIRQKVKRMRDHMNDTSFLNDVLGTKAARLLKQSSKPEEAFQRQGFRRLPKR
ncbi:MAG: hypothetical protein HYY45_12295 [Deltaproteobacteria bacterium]|nr:hypothetical protein [Deltaproteobacteria bacterium]